MSALLRSLARAFLPVSALLVVVLPTVLALFLARSAAMQRQREITTTMTEQVLARTEAIRADMLAAVARVGSRSGQDLCSPAGITSMRVALLHARYLSNVGYVHDDRLLCSAFGKQELPLGPPAYFSDERYDIRTGVRLDGAADVPMVAATRPETGLTLFVFSGWVMDAVPANEPWRVAVVGRGKGNTLLAGRGELEPGWLRRAARGNAGTFMYKHFVVAWANSKQGGAFTAFAAMPPQMWQPPLRASTWLALALGLPVSILLAVVLRRMMNRNTTLRSLLRQALRRGELTLAYQPIVELASGRWVGAEALLRWKRPNGEVVPPDIFIPVAEESGLMPNVREYLVRTLEREVPALFARHPDFHVALNFNADDICASGFPARLKLAMERTGARPRNLQIEVTERVFARLEEFPACIDALQKLGVSVSIDDFGTGYSSLSYLTRLKFDYLKIDRSFVQTIETGAVTSMVVEHIIAMAQSLDTRMIAEGVETELQADYLRVHGVQYAQGWLYAKAMAIAELIDQLSWSVGSQHAARQPVEP